MTADGLVEFVPAATKHDASRGSLLLGVACLAALTSSWSAARIGSLNLSDLFMLFTLVLAPFTSSIIRDSPRVHAWIALPTLVALVLTARDVVISGDSLGVVDGEASGLAPGQMLARVALSTLCVSLVCMIAIGDEQSRGRKVLKWWFAGVTVSAVFAILQGLGVVPDNVVLAQINGAERFAGLSSHPNALAQTIVLALPLCSYFVNTSSPRRRWLAVLMLVLLWIALVQTGSRAGLLGGFVVTLVALIYFAARLRVLRWILPLAILGVVAALIYGPQVISATRFVPSAGTAQSNSGRVQAISEGWASFLSHPFAGAGLGSWVGELAPLVLLACGGVLSCSPTWFSSSVRFGFCGQRAKRTWRSCYS
ncbi:O-antigen ligase family protein [Curtobacterium flaccumfaciens]|nr:O-antigen ligase family protein [Curtobacterium flaccumfaciens]